MLVKILNDYGYCSDGIDLSEEALKMGRERLGLSNLKKKNISEILDFDTHYDAVFAINVIEHLHDPVSFLDSVKCVIKPTPNKLEKFLS